MRLIEFIQMKCLHNSNNGDACEHRQMPITKKPQSSKGNFYRNISSRVCRAMKKCVRKSENNNDTAAKRRQTISAPYDIKHELSITYDYGNARFEGIPADDPAWHHVNRHFGIPAANIPKVQLVGYTVRIPAVLVMLKEQLFRHNGHLAPHIFREPPNKMSRDSVKQQIDLGEFTDCKDIHVLADLIKLWLRELPCPLLSGLNSSMMEELVQNDGQLRNALEEKLGDLDREVLFWMADLMLSVAEHEEINHMGIEQLCIVMAPSFYRIETQDPLEATLLSKVTVKFLRKVLELRRTARTAVADGPTEDVSEV